MSDGQRQDAVFIRCKDNEHVARFKARAGMGGVIMEGQEISAVVRYTEQLEGRIAELVETNNTLADALGELEIAQESQQGAVAPYCYIYEYDSAFGLHREFSPREWNAMQPTRTVPLYTHTADSEQIRRDALEEATQLCAKRSEKAGTIGRALEAMDLALAIRALSQQKKEG